MKLTNKTVLLLILVVAAVLRGFNYFDIPFTHDEFSALFRTNFDNFSDLIEKGVKIDTHPAGVQVFLYYWTKLFGMEEWIVKLPFTIFGLLSVWLLYLIAKKWYNETVALISAAFLASVQFTVMYSQIARPYISGLLFTLIMVYYWTALVKEPYKRFYRNSLGFVIAASLCTYNHHFSLLFAAIVGISGLFFIEKNYLRKYMFAGVYIFFLYIPHLNIFFIQLRMGGIGGWLAKPDWDFLSNFVLYVFNFSAITVILVVAALLYSLIKLDKRSIKFKPYILFVVWFLLPFLIGFFYSRLVNPVLRYSVLIFSFPFLYFVLFGFIKEQSAKKNFIIVLAILSLNTVTLVYGRQYYKLFYNSPYEHILLDHQDALNNHSNTISVIDSHKEISQYYLVKDKLDRNFVWFDTFSNEGELITFLKKQAKISDYLYFGCLQFNKAVTIPIIQDYFPNMVWQRNYAGGTTYLFSKEEQANNENEFVSILDFETDASKPWRLIDQDRIIDSISASGNKSYQFAGDSTKGSPVFKIPIEQIITNKNDFIDVSVKALVQDSISKILLVAELKSGEKRIHWGATPFDKFTANYTSDGWITVHHSIKLSDIPLNYTNIQLKISVWNFGKRTFLVDDFTIRLRKGNPVLYGLFEKIE